MPLWFSPDGTVWSTPSPTASTSAYYWPSTSVTTSTTSGYPSRLVAWYADAQTPTLGSSWYSSNSPSTYWGLAASRQEAAAFDVIERWTRPQMIHSPAIIRRDARERSQAAYAAQEARAAAHLEAQAARIQAHSDSSKQRALELLLEHLTPAQRETFHKSSWFIVEGRKSGTQYRVNARGSLVANIDVLRPGRPGRPEVSHRLCAHCEIGSIPLGDQLLAQKLMLEFDEDAFLRIANRHAP